MSERLHVLMATPRFLPFMGGVETHVAETAARLSGYGVDVTVLTADPTGSLPVEARMGDVRIVRARAFPRDRDWYLAPAITNIVARGRWDLVHCQSYHTLVAPLAMWAARRAGLPYVVTFHGGGSSSVFRNTMRRTQWSLLRPLLAQAQKLVALAAFEIELYGRHLGLPASRFALIPNGSTLPQPEAGPAATVPGRIISVGRLERYKGHHRVLAALPYVLRACPEAHLQIIGTGPYEPALRAQAQQLGVEARVTIGSIAPSERAHMAESVGSAALVALLSDYETHPIAALEAIALGRSVLVARQPGLADLAAQGLARAIDVNSSAKQVAQAIVSQLANPLVPPALTLPTWDDCAAQLAALYHSIVARPVCVS